MGCGTSFVKYVLFLFNLVFALAGLALLGVGVALKLKVSEVVSIFKDVNVGVYPILLIIIGAIIFTIAFFGCCGAVRESHCMVVTYAVLLLVIIIIQVVAAILIFVYVKDFPSFINRVVTESFNEATSGNNAASTEAFNALQELLHCCGSYGKTAYSTALPPSCCSSELMISGNTCSMDAAYNIGCVEALTNFSSMASKTLGGVAIGVAAVEIIAAIFALCLANSIRNMERRYA